MYICSGLAQLIHLLYLRHRIGLFFSEHKMITHLETYRRYLGILVSCNGSKSSWRHMDKPQPWNTVSNQTMGRPQLVFFFSKIASGMLWDSAGVTKVRCRGSQHRLTVPTNKLCGNAARREDPSNIMTRSVGRWY